jgi:molybdopterin-containing oxidoreductase family membrane subunit
MKVPAMGLLVHNRMEERLMITDRGLLTLRTTVQVAMIINVFLLLCEVFKEFYTGAHHMASSKYLFLGLNGYNALVPWIWTAIAFNIIAMILLVLPITRGLRWLNVACVLAILGIWIEKGMGLVIPGFIPTPLGEIIEYQPSLNETLICFGIWAFGLLIYTLLLKVAVPILQGRLAANDGQSERETPATEVGEVLKAGS